ncbi:hypothetical protein BJX96DRAFT_78470 [Aspergillus floccosus]
MYEPAPPRPKKTEIVRSRSGCKCCRERRTKCDEQKPRCGTCVRLGTTCQPVRQKFQFRITTGPSNSPPTSQQGRWGQDTGSKKTGEPRSSHSHPSLSMLGPCSRDIIPIPSLQLIQNLQYTERDVFYSTYWEEHCLPALNPVFRSISHLIGSSSALKNTVLALSACNLSRMNAEQKSSATISVMGTHTPNLTHLTNSQRYYCAAVRRFVQLSQQECRYNAATYLAMLILFAYIESAMGNFRGFYCHVQGLSAFLETVYCKETTSASVKSLLTAWMQPQFLVWWARAYFSSVDVQQQQSDVKIPRVLEGSCETFHERRIAVLSILCESHRLNFQAILKHWTQTTSHNALISESTYPAFEDDLDQYCMLLEKEAEKLEEWLSHLPPSERPSEDDSSSEISHSSLSSRPLRFESHDAALNYAYYILARIMQCTRLLRLIGTRDPRYIGSECYEEAPWVRLFVKIMNGINMKTCLRQNAYTIGFSGLVMAVLLRCQDLATGLCIQSWLQSLKDIQPTEEGSFPVYQALAVTQAINQQRMMERDIFAVSQPVDDTGSPKFSAYNSQVIDTLLVHGKSRSSGDLFTDCIRLYDAGHVNSGKDWR